MTHLSDLQIAQVAQPVGFSGDGLVTAIAICLAESGGVTDNSSHNGPTAGCPSGSNDLGLWQINSCYHADMINRYGGNAFDPHANAQMAYQISSGGVNWNSWCTYEHSACGGHGNASYRQYLPRARLAAEAVNATPVAPIAPSYVPPSTNPQVQPAPPGRGVAYKLVKRPGKTAIFVLLGGAVLAHIPTGDHFLFMGYDGIDVEELPIDHFVWRLPVIGKLNDINR